MPPGTAFVFGSEILGKVVASATSELVKKLRVSVTSSIGKKEFCLGGMT